MPLSDWSTVAVNLAEHADNAIHTDAGARAAGFDGALVAGVTTYAYLTHVPAVGWGMAWLTGGGATVRFHRPVLDGDRVDCVVAGDDGDGDDGTATVLARVGDEVRAEATFARSATAPDERDGERLEPFHVDLGASWSDYGARAGDDAPAYLSERIAHPTSWPRLANRFCHEQLVRGPWIHVRSDVVHLGVAPVGSRLDARAVVVDRFDTRAGRRVVLDVRVACDGDDVAAIEHEAIVELASA